MVTITALLAATSSTALAQAGTVTFGGTGNNSVPTLDFNGGPALSFSSRLLQNFGDAALIPGNEARWWTGLYSGQGMVYGNSSAQGSVLELRLEAASGFDLLLGGALFGGYVNTARHVTFQLFSDDFTQSTGPQTILTGSTSAFFETFASNGWGNAIRLQFSETDADGLFTTGRGAFDVGIQDIAYSIDSQHGGPPAGVPEPGALALLASGFTGLMVVARRRRTA